MDLIIVLGSLASVIQVVGYYYYITKTGRNDISPNPTTWLIFAFDTTLLVFLEAIAGASLALLLLPFMCALGAIYVAWLVRKAGRLHWPEDKADSYILSIGILIAIIYTSLFFLSEMDIMPYTYVFLAGIFFLILSNLNTIIAFIPIIREVYKDPLHENAGPWSIWTIAYLVLAYATYLEVGLELSGVILYIYPVSCAILHGTVALLARDSRKLTWLNYT